VTKKNDAKPKPNKHLTCTYCKQKDHSESFC
jgi:hypothetical protein